MSYSSRLKAELNWFLEVQKDPIAFAKKKDLRGKTDDELKASALAFANQCAISALNLVDFALNEANKDGYLIGKMDAKPIEPEPAEPWLGVIRELVDECCNVSLQFGIYGVGCSISDPELGSGVNSGGKRTPGEAVKAAAESRKARKPMVTQ